jgi:ubiquinone/menaquinone biosynthesis C-methylase UbiE
MGSEEVQKQRAIATHSDQASEFAESYITLEEDAFRTCFTYSRRRLEQLLTKYIPARGDGTKMLDVGCGTGHHMASLRARGFEVAGVDGSEEMLEHARQNNPGEDIRLADVEKLPFESASFDYVICIEVLRYLPNMTKAICEMARVLKPGGMCLVTAAPTFNLNGYYVINRVANAVPIGSLVRLKQFFATSWHLRKEFDSAGFPNPKVHGVYFGPVNWVEHLSPGLLPRVLKKWESVDEKVADKPGFREFANMFLIVGHKGRIGN